MRYLLIPDVLFTTIRGNSFTIKDMREIPTYQTLAEYKMQIGDDIDEIISRTVYYGAGSEIYSYLIVDHNKEVLWENKYDLSTIKFLKVPVSK